ncbi:MAG TPA: hypothetical protein VFL90_17495 [Methylomirabilota bacterium]|nr:hypothetical protein [Methylomirabilota bacterium]
MIVAALAVLLVAAPAAALDVAVEPYRQASLAGTVGTVTGRVYAESRTPNGPAQPITGTTVTLLPRSQALVLELERLKEQSRQSSKAFAAAAPAMRRAQDEFERALLTAGAPDLSPRMQVAADGTFRVADVPAGDWLLVAWHSSPADVSVAKSRPRDRQLYQLDKRLTGYQAVIVWLRDLMVSAGQTSTLELTDRNEWFRGVIEERSLDAGR